LVFKGLLQRDDPKEWLRKQENREFHRQEIVKHEECLEVLIGRKLQDEENEWSETW
jgi:hypothetical protein